jgi:predicted metal-dependent hydrolase
MQDNWLTKTMKNLDTEQEENDAGTGEQLKVAQKKLLHEEKANEVITKSESKGSEDEKH